MPEIDEVRRELRALDDRLERFAAPQAEAVLPPELRLRLKEMRKRRAELFEEERRLEAESGAGEENPKKGKRVESLAADLGVGVAPDDGKKAPSADAVPPPGVNGELAGEAAATGGDGDSEVRQGEDGGSAGFLSEKERGALIERGMARVAAGRLTEEERAVYRYVLTRHRAYAESRSLLDMDSAKSGVEREKSPLWDDYRRDLESLCRAGERMEGLPRAPLLRRRLSPDLAADLVSARLELAALKELAANVAGGEIREEAAGRVPAGLAEGACEAAAPAVIDVAALGSPSILRRAEGSETADSESAADPAAETEEMADAGEGGKEGAADGAGRGPEGEAAAALSAPAEATGDDGAAFLDVPVKVSVVFPKERCGFANDRVSISVDAEAQRLDKAGKGGLRMVGPVGFRRLALGGSSDLCAMVEEFVGNRGRGVKIRTGVMLAPAPGDPAGAFFADVVLEAGPAVVMVQRFPTGGRDWRYVGSEDRFVARDLRLPGFMGDAYRLIGRLRVKRQRRSLPDIAEWCLVTVFEGGGSIDLSEIPEDVRENFLWARMSGDPSVRGRLEAAEAVFYRLVEQLERAAASDEGAKGARGNPRKLPVSG